MCRTTVFSVKVVNNFKGDTDMKIFYQMECKSTRSTNFTVVELPIRLRVHDAKLGLFRVPINENELVIMSPAADCYSSRNYFNINYSGNDLWNVGPFQNGGLVANETTQ